MIIQGTISAGSAWRGICNELDHLADDAIPATPTHLFEAHF
jgi:hypothetical protein